MLWSGLTLTYGYVKWRSALARFTPNQDNWFFQYLRDRSWACNYLAFMPAIADHTCTRNAWHTTTHSTVYLLQETMRMKVQSWWASVHALRMLVNWWEPIFSKWTVTSPSGFLAHFTKSKNYFTTVQVLDDSVDESPTVKLLGVTLDGLLSLCEHIKRILVASATWIDKNRILYVSNWTFVRL